MHHSIPILLWQLFAVIGLLVIAVALFVWYGVTGDFERWVHGGQFLVYAVVLFTLFVLVAALQGCGPDGPALPPPPDFAARPCATVPVCSPDMGRDLSTVEDLRFFLDLAAQP